MERLSRKRSRPIQVPIQVEAQSQPVWDDMGGVFTQENPSPFVRRRRFHSRKFLSLFCVGDLLCFLLVVYLIFALFLYILDVSFIVFCILFCF